MRVRTVEAAPKHEVAYQELAAVLKKQADLGVSAEELLAIAANMLGKLIAMQDQRTMTSERALKIVIENMTHGNEELFAQLHTPKGSA